MCAAFTLRSVFSVRVLLAAAGLWVAGGERAVGIVLYDTDNALTNTTAPTGSLAGSGWDFQGEYGSYLGTMIGPQHFITAQHFGTQGGTFVSTAEFNGVADATYTIDAAANGGQGYWNIAGTDLRVFKVVETFSSYATLYSGSGEVGLDLVVFGRGGPRGAEVMLGPEAKGWLHTGADGVARWGENTVSATLMSGGGPLLAATFSAVAVQNEATLSVGDSGGGVFVNDGGLWKLAGINYGVDGLFDTNNTTGDGMEFSAALFDKGGFYEGSDGTGWNLVPDLAGDVPSRMYSSRISSSLTEIQGIVGVPEPGGLLLLAVAGLAALAERRRAVGAGVTFSARQR